jgi:enoyl-CoA hydratase/carnithine racemase
VRHAIFDADARMRWATFVSARILAGAFAVAWEWGNTELLSQLVEYHSARGAFSTEPSDSATAEWMGTATAAVPVEADDEYALVAAGSASVVIAGGLTRLGPLPPLRMDPNTPPLLSRYRELAFERYGRDITADEVAWSTWP